jgi:hypothetical protein
MKTNPRSRSRQVPQLLAILTAAALLTRSAEAETAYPAWIATHDSSTAGNFAAEAIDTDASGNIYVAGYSTDATGKMLFYVAKHDALDGHRIWAYEHDAGAGDNAATAIAVDPSGSSAVVATGYVRTAAGGRDIYTVRLNTASEGMVLWKQTYAGPAGGDDRGLKVLIDSAGDAIVTGVSPGANTGNDWFTAKYAKVTGAPLWGGNALGIRYNAAGNGDDVPAAIALDGSKNLYITGAGTRANGLTSFITAKYAAADGTLLWNGQLKAFDSAGHAEPKGIAVDEDGNAVVTGIGRNAGGFRLFQTISYAATDGATRWSATHQNPGAPTFGGPVGVVVDGDGNAIVAGTEIDTGGSRFFYTAKYKSAAPNAGSVLWEKRSASRDGDDRASAIAVDSAGDVVVTGVSAAPETHDLDLLTIKYARPDGAVRWERIHRGSNRDERVADILFDRTGETIIAGATQLVHSGTGNAFDRLAVIKYQRLFFEKGSPAPNAGNALFGVPAGATIASVRTPAVSDTGRMAAVVTLKTGGDPLTAVVLQPVSGAAVVLALQGRPAPSPGTGSFARFSDPLIDDAGRIAFVAKLSGVPDSQSTAVFINTPSGPVRALQQGVEIAGTDGLRLRSVLGMSWQNSVLLVSGSITGPGVNLTNNKVLLSYTAAGGAKILLRTGDLVEVDGVTSEIHAIGALKPLPGVSGHCRTQGLGKIIARATLADKRSVVITAAIDGSSAAVDLHTGQPSGLDPGAVWKSFGVPAIDPSGTRRAVLGKQAIGPGKVLATDDTAIMGSNGGGEFVLIAREGSLIPSLSGFRYGTLRNPILNVQGRVAWISTVRREGVTTETDTCIFEAFVTGKEYRLIARTGDPVPSTSGELEANLFYRRFTSVGLPGAVNDGSIFVARLSGAGVTAQNNVGLFQGATSFSKARRLLRTGDNLGARVIAAIKLLQARPGSIGATRSFSDAHHVAVQLTFTDRTKAILRLSLP